MSFSSRCRCVFLFRSTKLTLPTTVRSLASMPRHDAPMVDEAPVNSPLAHPDYFGVKSLVTMEDLLNARVHLGHKTGMWNPLMKPFIFGSRAGIHIFDLTHTLQLLHKALNVAAHIAYRGGIILFVNERPQFEGLVQRTARECNEYYVTQKWRGGTLTNSHKLLGTMRLPDLMIFTSVPPSKTAVKEAAMTCVSSIGVVDSDCDPNLIMYPIPGNDDSPAALKLYCKLFSDAILLAKDRAKTDVDTGVASIIDSTNVEK